MNKFDDAVMRVLGFCLSIIAIGTIIGCAIVGIEACRIDTMSCTEQAKHLSVKYLSAACVKELGLEKQLHLAQ